MKNVNVGDAIPQFSLPDQNNEVINIADKIGNNILVIYFYPKDDTPGCTAEACSFRDQYQDFTDAGAEVIGISFDSPSRHKKFAAKHRLPFTLLSDSKKQVLKAFGVPTLMFGMLPGRVTYVVDRQGVIQHVYNSNANATQHVQESLQIIKKLQEA